MGALPRNSAYGKLLEHRLVSTRTCKSTRHGSTLDWIQVVRPRAELNPDPPPTRPKLKKSPVASRTKVKSSKRTHKLNTTSSLEGLATPVASTHQRSTLTQARSVLI